MITPLSTSLLLPAELSDTISRYSITITESGIENDFFPKVLPLLEADNNRLNRAISAVRNNVFVDAVSVADSFRDDSFIGFRDMVGAYKHRRNEELAMAYEKVWPIIKKTGTRAYKLGYTAQSGKLAAMFAKLDEPDYQAALTTLNVLDIYNELKQYEVDFKAIHKDRLDADDLLNYPTLQEARYKAIPHVNTLLSFIDIMEEIEPEIYAPLVEKLNNITEQIMTVVRARKTRNEDEG